MEFRSPLWRTFSTMLLALLLVMCLNASAQDTENLSTVKPLKSMKHVEPSKVVEPMEPIEPMETVETVEPVEPIREPADLEAPLEHSVIMDSQGKYVMSWTPNMDDFVMEITVEARGYVGIGFSPNGGMLGADTIIAWVDQDQQVHLSDRYAYGYLTPEVDASQDVQLISGRRNDTHTTVRFRRPWVTCDTEHDLPITSDTTRVIYAYGNKTPDPSARGLPYHDGRGTRSLYLREPHQREPQMPEDVQHWDVLARNISVPSTLSTLYWCSMFKMPPIDTKRHIIRFKPLIEHASAPIVHHIILYECHLDNSTEHLEPWVGHKGAQCHSANMPTSWRECQGILMAWAIGSEGENMPPHAGIPVGEEYGGASYFMMETHYNTPNNVQDLHDSSGVRMYHTAKLRQHDMGIMYMGHEVSPLMLVGPGSMDWSIVSHYSADSTNKTLPAEGVNITSGILHSHLMGHAMVLQHIRGGKELPPLLQDLHFDFNYQQQRHLPEERVLLPGDRLILTCHYNSMDRNSTSYGGFSTSEEMCLAFVNYYPRINNVKSCLSIPDVTLLAEALGLEITSTPKKKPISNMDNAAEKQKIVAKKEKPQPLEELRIYRSLNAFVVQNPPELRNSTLLDVLSNPAIWEEPDMVRRLKEYQKKGAFRNECSKELTYYEDFEPYLPPPPSCIGPTQE